MWESYEKYKKKKISLLSFDLALMESCGKITFSNVFIPTQSGEKWKSRLVILVHKLNMSFVKLCVNAALELSKCHEGDFWESCSPEMTFYPVYALISFLEVKTRRPCLLPDSVLSLFTWTHSWSMATTGLFIFANELQVFYLIITSISFLLAFTKLCHQTCASCTSQKCFQPFLCSDTIYNNEMNENIFEGRLEKPRNTSREAELVTAG